MKERDKQFTLQDVVEEAEEKALKEAFTKYGNIKDVAEALGISYSTAVRRLKRYGLNE
jgi:transcriptional regulator with PAS, ATPase and Fis domain